jgi:hypothetical protein
MTCPNLEEITVPEVGNRYCKRKPNTASKAKNKKQILTLEH